MNKKLCELLIFIPLLLTLVVTSCAAQKGVTSCGIVVNRTLFYDRSLNKYVHDEFYAPDTKIWFKGSNVIVQTMGIHAPTLNGIVTKREVVLMYYTYIDLMKMVFYKYANFSDTAKIIQSYNQAQSDTIIWKVDWRFYERKDITHTEPIENLADTAIDGSVFKRIKIINKPTGDSNETTTSIAYFDCTRKDTIFQLNNGLSEKIGCPMVAYYILPIQKYQGGGMACKIEFVSDKLTKEELKVFNAWEKNVKKYPVKQ